MIDLKHPILALSGLLALSVSSLLGAENPTHGFLNRVHKDADGKEAKYVLFIPHTYKSDTPCPLIMFLHGSGETGTDGIKPSVVGLGAAVKKQEKTFPCIVIFPQSQKRSWRARQSRCGSGPGHPGGSREGIQGRSEACLSDGPVDGRLRHLEPRDQGSQPLGGHCADLRRRQSRQGRPDQGPSLLVLPWRGGHGRAQWVCPEP